MGAWDSRIGGGSGTRSRTARDAAILDYVDARVERVDAAAQAANYTLALADAGTVVEGTKATAQTVTVPPNASVAFPVGAVIEVVQIGAGQVTIVAGSGVTLRTAATLTTRAQYSAVVLRQRATDEWVVGGDLT